MAPGLSLHPEHGRAFAAGCWIGDYAPGTAQGWRQGWRGIATPDDGVRRRWWQRLFAA